MISKDSGTLEMLTTVRNFITSVETKTREALTSKENTQSHPAILVIVNELSSACITRWKSAH